MTALDFAESPTLKCVQDTRSSSSLVLFPNLLCECRLEVVVPNHEAGPDDQLKCNFE